MPASAWGGGIGVGNGLELHAAHISPHVLVLGRLRGKWWHETTDTGSGWLSSDSDGLSRQFEAAALLGYPVAAGRSVLYGATGLAYVNGQQAGAYRYTVRSSGLLSDPTNYYAHRNYQALGVPLELGWLSPPLGSKIRLGVTGQANLNPQQSVFCLLTTVWFGGMKSFFQQKP